MKNIILFLLVLSLINISAYSQKKNRIKDKTPEQSQTLNAETLTSLKQHITILASDSLQGRRTGSMGEQMAAAYIKNQFFNNGLLPMGNDDTYFQNFPVNDGLNFEKYSSLFINDRYLQPNTDYFTLPQSGSGVVNEIASPILRDANALWFYDLAEDLEKNKTNPHYDITPHLTKKITELAAKGAKGLVIYNSNGKLTDNISYSKNGTLNAKAIPIIYLTNTAYKTYIKANDAVLDIKLKIDLRQLSRTGTNIIGYIDNKATNTVVIGAHYDHLGMGEDKNSLYAGTTPQIHNGADDNASGVAALIELAKLIPSQSLTNSNYLFIAFSGEELGLYGSKYFTDNPTIPLSSINYMINMDMIGRLIDSTNRVTIGGYGTAANWSKIVLTKEELKNNTTIKNLELLPDIKIDSSGTGPSDHSSFYRKNIPVLFFFTGTHGDYHKPSDDVEKINFLGEAKIINYILYILSQTKKEDKLVFLKTRETSMGSSTTRFKVSLGIMPDYTYSGSGVRADGVSDGKLAQKIGIKAGDVITALNDTKITSVENYMQVLSKYNKGDKAILITTRGGKVVKYEIVF